MNRTADKMDVSWLGQFWLREAAAAKAMSANMILQEQQQEAAGRGSKHA
jgi:hypothetical protein